jgi:hypothetical protein
VLILLCGQPAVIGLATSPYKQTNITDSYLLILLSGLPAVIGLATIAHMNKPILLIMYEMPCSRKRRDNKMRENII